MLSVAEDLHFKIAVVDPLDDPRASIFVDGLLNSLTHPLRVLHDRSPKDSAPLTRKYIDEHYGLASKWLHDAEDYNQFCSIFPLFHAKQIDLEIKENCLIASYFSPNDLSYEAYDRFVAKRDPRSEDALDPNLITGELISHLSMSGGIYSVDFTRSLMARLMQSFSAHFAGRHVLPENWEFSTFSLAQYRSIFVCLQVMGTAWFVARQIVASKGVAGIAYEGSIWTPKKTYLVTLVARHTGLSKALVGEVLRYLTFGEVGVRDPDIAIQPIIDLANGQYAISPFVLTHMDAERNLCVLLNQVPADYALYSRLVNEKEGQLRAETINALTALGFSFRHGQLDQTDVDLAIIDHATKTCLCVELKWFIEPAEVREVRTRSLELSKGVVQARTLDALFCSKDPRLLALLEIDASYDFLAMVGSVNFIGLPSIQDESVPITKLWHLVSKIQATGSLPTVFNWLRTRAYLPRKDHDYKVHEMPIECGSWKSRWYGLSHVSQSS